MLAQMLVRVAARGEWDLSAIAVMVARSIMECLRDCTPILSLELTDLLNYARRNPADAAGLASRLSDRYGFGGPMAPPAAAAADTITPADALQRITCSICVAKLVSQVLPCGHVYCAGCVAQLQPRCCPQCRQPFTETRQMYL